VDHIDPAVDEPVGEADLVVRFAEMMTGCTGSSPTVTL
jgi:hypothetical protein